VNRPTVTGSLSRQVAVWLLLVLALVTAQVDADDQQSSGALERLRTELPAKKLVEIASSDLGTIPLTKADAASARELLYRAYTDHIRKDREQELNMDSLNEGELSMPFVIREFGEAPKAGHSIWISLHGGGGAPKQVNDGQWENQKRLYTLEEGFYVTPRAPTNTWNLWHESHIDRLFARLIEDLVVVRGADPDRVYVMGYSAGGDGVYQLAPRMADYWAAAAMMAGHPNDASPLGLRNVPFALQVGAKDAAYDRNKIGTEWGQKLDQLHQSDPDGYAHFVKIHEGRGHWMNLDDKAAIPWMAKFHRNATPKRVVWKQSSVAHDSFYWLAVPAGTAKAGSMVVATVKGQTVQISEASDVTHLLVRLDDRLVDLDQPVTVRFLDKNLFEGIVPRTVATLQRTLDARRDRQLMFDGEIAVEIPTASQ
jgi:poly(3-hydroxybutyrate) depolymerase